MKWIIGTLTVAVVAAVSVGLSLFVTGYWSTEISEGSGAIAAVSESEGDGLHDGIKIYGEYEIEVRDPDGTLVAKRVFPNTVTDNGKEQIIKAMSGVSNPFPTWTVLFSSPNLLSEGVCQILPCGIRVGLMSYSESPPCTIGSGCPFQDTATLNVSGNSMTLNGSYIVGNNPDLGTTSKIDGIATFFGDQGYQSLQFSRSDFNSITVTKGQTIHVTYTFSIN